MYSGQAADQVINQSLKATEVISKLAGLGAKHLAVLLYSLVENSKDFFKSDMWKIAEDGSPQVVPMSRAKLEEFKNHCNSFKVLNAVVDDKSGDIVDVVVRQSDAPLINHIFEKMGFGKRYETEVVDVSKKDNPFAQHESELSEQGNISNFNGKAEIISDDKPSVIEKVENIKVSLKVEDKKPKEAKER
jgi:hypothetical protein